MIRLVASVALLANMFTLIAWGQASRPPVVKNDSNVESDQVKLVALANKWTEAISNKDREKLDQLMAPEYALNTWDGKVLVPRSKWMDNLFTHITIEKNTLVDIFPRIYGDVAMMTSKGDWVGVEDGRHFNQKCTVLDTWRLIAGAWRVVNRTSDCIDQ